MSTSSASSSPSSSLGAGEPDCTGRSSFFDLVVGALEDFLEDGFEEGEVWVEGVAIALLKRYPYPTMERRTRLGT